MFVPNVSQHTKLCRPNNSENVNNLSNNLFKHIICSKFAECPPEHNAIIFTIRLIFLSLIFVKIWEVGKYIYLLNIEGSQIGLN